jgi:CRP/FNR family transcriptional regulator, cyclic AMP receptor protein
MSVFIEEKFVSGDVLFKAGDVATTFYVLQSGEIHLIDSKSGNVFAKLEPGDTFGEQAMLAGGVRSATAVAVMDCDCLKLDAAGLNQILAAESTTSNLVFRALHLQLFMQNALAQTR